MQLSDLLPQEALRAVMGQNGLHRRLPRQVYREPAFLRLEYENWLQRSWLLVARHHEVPDIGSAYPIPGQPIFLLRGNDNKVRAFFNSCRHRGHELINKPCKVGQRVVCPYHHWSYDLEGRLRSATHFAGYNQHSHPQLDPIEFGLKELRCESWHHWILINIDGQAEDLGDFTAPFDHFYGDVDFSQVQHFATVRRHPLPVNWKTAMENNIEPYHVPMVHPDTAGGHPFEQHRIIDDDQLVGCAVDIEGSAFTNRAPDQTKEDASLDTSGRFVLRVPNLYLASHAPDKLVDSIILPDWEDPERCYVSHACYTTSGSPMTREETALWRDLQEQVLVEDEAVMTGVSRGFRAPVMDDGGVISPAWESCVSGFYRNYLSALQSMPISRQAAKPSRHEG